MSLVYSTVIISYSYDGPGVKEQITKLFIFTTVLGGEKINLYFFPTTLEGG